MARSGEFELILDREIKAYEAKRADLERDHYGKFALFVHSDLIKIFDDFNTAARTALAQFGYENPFLIRQIGAERLSAASQISHVTGR